MMLTRIMVTSTLFISILLCLAPLTPAQQGVLLPPAPRTLLTHRDEAGGFSIAHPDTWTISQQEAPPLVYTTLSSPQEGPDDPFIEALVITTETLPTPFVLADYFEQSLANLERQLTGFQARPPFDLTLSGLTSRGIAFTGQYGNHQLAWVLLVTGRNERAYALILTALPENLETFWHDSADIVTSFTLLEPEIENETLASSEQGKASLLQSLWGTLVFTQDIGEGATGIYIVLFEDLHRKFLTLKESLCWQPAFSPDGSSIVYATWYFKNSLRFHHLTKTTNIPLTDND